MARERFPWLLLSVAVVLLDVCLLNSFILGAQISIKNFEGLINVSAADIAKELGKVSIPGVTQKIITDVQNKGHRLVEVFEDSNGSFLECNALGSKDIINAVLKVIPEGMITDVTKDEMQEFLDLCNFGTENTTQGLFKSIFDFISDILSNFLIFPGTKWCGPGDIAENYSDLGSERETDLCCRDHDFPSDYIPAFETEHGITNFLPYSMTNCLDDCKFFNCLLNVGRFSSEAIGGIFFDILGADCFAYGYPQKCVKYNVIYIPLLTRPCREYQIDTSQSLEWRTYSQPGFLEADQPRNCTQYNHTA